MSVERARSLRKRMSPAEARVWNLLRTAPLKPFHFRRQVPIGTYYADFASHEARLVIEIDGWTHSSDAEVAYDARRTARLEADGYRVLRFNNASVMNHLDGVFEVLVDALRLSEGTREQREEGNSRPSTPTQLR